MELIFPIVGHLMLVKATYVKCDRLHQCNANGSYGRKQAFIWRILDHQGKIEHTTSAGAELSL
jgi:hypothetical protein